MDQLEGHSVCRRNSILTRAAAHVTIRYENASRGLSFLLAFVQPAQGYERNHEGLA